MEDRFSWLAPMVLWPTAKVLVPRPGRRPQGGGNQRVDDEAVFASITYVLVSGAPWRNVPKSFGVSWQTAHRRFTEWSRVGLWEELDRSLRAAYAPPSLRRWSAAVAAAAGERLREASQQGRPTPDSIKEFSHPAGADQPSRLSPGIPRKLNDEFAERLFGARRPAASASASAQRPVPQHQVRSGRESGVPLRCGNGVG